MLVALLLGIASRAEALTATTAEDVCAADANPCTVTDVVHVTPGATLNFEGRAVEITGGGCFDFGSGSGNIFSGAFTADTEDAAIIARGRINGGGTDSGDVVIQAERLCSAANPPAPCLEETDCHRGTCSARRCELRPSTRCFADADCAGACINRRCNNTVLFQRCTVNEDCNFGSCPDQLTCSSNSSRVRNCTVDADCELGSCTIGDASITINSPIDGHSDSTGSITLTAADSVTISKTVDLTGTAVESSGGDLNLEAVSGNAHLGGMVRARSGGHGSGGRIDIEAGRDAIISAPVDAPGGDFDGGWVDVECGRDAVISSDLNLTARSGEGYGGFLDITAGRNVRIGRPGGAMRIRNSGHTVPTGAGDAGGIYVVADGDLEIAEGVEIRSRARRDAYAGFIDVGIRGNFRFAGTFDARGGRLGAAGSLDVATAGHLEMAGGSRVDLRGGDGGATYVELTSEMGNATLAGNIAISGFAGELYVGACNIRFAGTWRSFGPSGDIDLYAYDSVTTRPGSSLSASEGDISLYGRSTPLLEGDISPVPTTYLLDGESGCAVCGDSVIQGLEECDDGNASADDGCDSDCLFE